MPAVAMVALMALSVAEQNKSRRAANKANRQERRMAAAQNLRERKQAYRQMVIQQAQMQAVGTNLGISGSSGLAGGMASLASQTASNIGFQNQLEAMNQQRLTFLSSAANYNAKAQMYGSAANFTMSASNAGWFDKKPKPKQPGTP